MGQWIYRSSQDRDMVTPGLVLRLWNLFEREISIDFTLRYQREFPVLAAKAGWKIGQR